MASVSSLEFYCPQWLSAIDGCFYTQDRPYDLNDYLILYSVNLNDCHETISNVALADQVLLAHSWQPSLNCSDEPPTLQSYSICDHITECDATRVHSTISLPSPTDDQHDNRQSYWE